MPTQVKEKPILMSSEMVRAILDGRKTQTRRVAKLPLFNAKEMRVDSAGRVEALVTAEECRRVGIEPLHEGPHWHHVVEDTGRFATCPYGQVGDRIWVREAHYVESAGYPDGREKFVLYRATDSQAPVSHWTPSIHMPRWASRITLEIADVRVERLQDISGRDCAAEGCEPDWEAFNDATCCDEGWEEPEEFIEECENECDWINYGHELVHSNEHKEWERDRRNYALRLAYKYLWDRINGKKHPWSSNPWVWVIEFKRA